MKPFKLIYLFAALFLMYSCSNEEEYEDVTQLDSIESQISKAHEIFLQIQEDNPNLILTFSMDGNDLISKFEIVEDDAKIMTKGSDNTLEPVCKGDGVKFAKCVKKAVDKLGCVVVKTCAYCAYPCK